MAKSLKDQLAKIALREVRLSDGRKLNVAMADEAKRLYRCIQKYIDEYYNSYTPHIYERTDGYKKALYADEVADIRIVGNTLRIGVSFRNDLSMHPNLDEVFQMDKYGNEYYIPIKDHHESFVPLLMETGWNAPRLANMIGRSIHMLTYFEGIHAVEKGIADFNATNKLGIKVNADDFYNGKVY